MYNLLGSHIIPDEQNVKIEIPVIHKSMSDKCGAQFVYKGGNLALKGAKRFDRLSKTLLRSVLTANDILKLSHGLRNILHK